MEVANDEKNHSTDVVTSVVDKGNAKTTMGSACLKREPEELKTPTTASVFKANRSTFLERIESIKNKESMEYE